MFYYFTNMNFSLKNFLRITISVKEVKDYEINFLGSIETGNG